MTTSHVRLRRTARRATAGLLALAICLACPIAPAQANDTDLSPAGDPFVLYEGGHYFAFATGAVETTCPGGSAAMYVPHRSSTSLSNSPDPPSFPDALP